MANASAVDEGIGTGYSAKKAAGGSTGAEIIGCTPADTAKDPQTQNGGYSAKRTEGTPSEIEDPASQ